MNNKHPSSLRFELNNYLNWKIYIVLILIIFSLSAYVRYNQYNYWVEHKDIYFVQNYPAMTTLDAYYWLRYAKEYKNGEYYKTKKDKLRSYPYGTTKSKVPLISYIIAQVSNITHLSIYKSGLFLVPILASLFVVPAALFFYLSSMPAAGMLGAFIGTFSWMYFLRTSMGRVDTDLLQLFFIFSSSLFMLLMLNAKKISNVFINFALSLIFMYLFILWYGHAGIAAVYGSFALLILFIKTFKDKNMFIVTLFIASGFFVFALMHGYINSLIGMIHGYIFPFVDKDSFVFPNIINTITETTHMSIMKNLHYVLSSKLFDIIGVIAFVISVFFLRAKILPLIPTLALGGMSFVGSNRAVMFFAPFVGFGIGFMADAIMSKIKDKTKLKNIYIELSGVFLIAVLVFATAQYSAIKFNPKPSIGADIVNSFLNIKKKVKKANIFSWWDYGYAIEDIDGFSTFHDGGVHGGVRTYLIGKAFADNNQKHIYGIISFVENGSLDELREDVKKSKNPNKIIDTVLNYNKNLKSNSDYLLFTRDMISKFGAISYFGNWDFIKKKTEPMGFQKLQCSSFKNDILSCMGIRFDLDRGLINGKVPIKRIVFVKDGYAAEKMEYSDKGVIAELIIKKNALLYLLLCGDKMYRTNFNQIYILGNYDKNLFDEVYNNFPSARLFRLKSLAH
jgi:undecaprenyl-diphosphooligosaccharide--protein glycosyltransferase